MASTNWKSSRIVKKNAHIDRIFVKEETRAHVKKVSAILKKAEANRTEDEWQLLQTSDDVVEVILKRTQVKEKTRQRHLEIEDSAELLQDKCAKLASVIRNAKSLAVYTGAGISTAASIPDYRGPNGVWTLLKQGKQLTSLDLCDAEPTLTHMAIVELYKRGYVKYVVSQNCDGLHLRSGLPCSALSELHGNMYIEVCRECQPSVEYVRLFDVTERTAMRRHKTGRRCLRCSSALFDTIVHFGEKGATEVPYNWHQAVEAADSADVILCLGSSLKVLKKYACLWGMHKPVAKRPRLFIVNLQWTPKDPVAALKINGRCDHVMRMVMKHLEIDFHPYLRDADPIFALASQLRVNEHKSTTKKMLTQLESSSSLNCSSNSSSSSPVHSDEKWGKDRRRSISKKQQQFSGGQPIRVMPARRVKSSAQRTISISKHALTSCEPTPGGIENVCDRSGNCSSVMQHTTEFDVKKRTGAMESSNIEDAEDRSAENSRKKLCGCCSSCNVNSSNHVEELKLQSLMGDRRLEESNAAGVTSWHMLTDFQRMSSWRRDFECRQLLNQIDKHCDVDRANGNGTSSFWWDNIDSRTWLEALQAYLMHLSSGRKVNVTEGNSCASSTSGCHFTASNLTTVGAASSSTSSLSADDVVGCIVSKQNNNAGELFRDASKERQPCSVDVSSRLSCSAGSQQKHPPCCSDEVHRRLSSKQNCECYCSQRLLTDSKEAIEEESSKLELHTKCLGEWLSGTPLMNPCNGSDMLSCGRKLCKGTGKDEQAMKLCTLSDLKAMHNVLFDSKNHDSSSATSNVCKASGCMAVNAIPPADSKPLNNAMLELNVTDVNANAKSLMANAELVRFMHSYCQPEMGAKREACGSQRPKDMSLLSRSPSDYDVPASFVDFLQEIICSKKDTEQVRTGQGIGHIETNRLHGVNGVNGGSEMVKGRGVRSFRLEESCSDTLQSFDGCIAQQKQFCAAFNFARKCDGHADDKVVSRHSCQDVDEMTRCLAAQSSDDCCDLSSRNVDADSNVMAKKRKLALVSSTAGWFGKGISLRKRKRKFVR